MNAVQEQINNVSVNTPKVWIKPCFTGWVTSAVAAAFGALPIPASFENKPLLIPCITAAPSPPAVNCFIPKADSNISLKTDGISVIFKIKTIIAIRI